jgi:hypothetical protein
MLPPPMPRCCRCHHHAAAALPKALLLPIKLRFRQAAASAAKLAAAAVLPPTPPLPPRCHRHATTAYKIIKNVILLTSIFFTMMVMAAHSNDGRNESTCIEKGKPKNNKKIRQHEKTNPSFNSPSPFPLSNPFFAQTDAIAIVIAVHPDNCQRCMRPTLSPPQQPAAEAAAVMILHDPVNI